MNNKRTILKQISYSKENKAMLSLHLRIADMTYRETVERSDRGNKILDMSSKENRGCFFLSEAFNAVHITPPVRFIQKDPTEN